MPDKSTGEISDVNVNVNGSSPPLNPPRSRTWNSSRSFGRSVSRQWRQLAALKRRSEKTPAAAAQNSNTQPPAPVVDAAVTPDNRHSDEEESENPKNQRDLEKKKKKKQMRKRQRKAREIHTEALHNTRDTITLVAMLIATFSFNAGVSPPGGVHQDGDSPLMGTAVAARKTAFRVFWVCNNVALFVSICIVLVMISIIPFRRRALMRMLSMAHKAVWVAVSFMATAYVAAEFTIMHPPPRLRGMRWTSVFLLSVCGGSLGAVFLGVGVMWVRHRLMKKKWREQNPRRWSRRQSRREKVEDFISQLPAEGEGEGEEPKRGDERENSSDEDDDDVSSEDSDMASSLERGYHTY